MSTEKHTTRATGISKLSSIAPRKPTKSRLAPHFWTTREVEHLKECYKKFGCDFSTIANDFSENGMFDISPQRAKSKLETKSVSDWINKTGHSLYFVHDFFKESLNTNRI